MDNVTPSKTDFFPAYIAVGAIGAIGEAWILYHSLVNTYPFKMMETRIYYIAGIAGMLLAPSVSIACAKFLPIKSHWLCVPLMVVLCPMLFLLAFDCFYWFSPYSREWWAKPRFDSLTMLDTNREFAQTAFSLTAFGLIIGIMCGAGLALLEKGYKTLARRLP
jgi:hypothetical protein